MKAAPLVAAHEEGLELVEGEEEAQQAQVLLDVGEQETQLMELLSAQRSRQGVYTGPVQFEVEEEWQGTRRMLAWCD